MLDSIGTKSKGSIIIEPELKKRFEKLVDKMDMLLKKKKEIEIAELELEVESKKLWLEVFNNHSELVKNGTVSWDNEKKELVLKDQDNITNLFGSLKDILK